MAAGELDADESSLGSELHGVRDEVAERLDDAIAIAPEADLGVGHEGGQGDVLALGERTEHLACVTYNLARIDVGHVDREVSRLERRECQQVPDQALHHLRVAREHVARLFRFECAAILHHCRPACENALAVAATFSSVWLELVITGLVTAVVASLRLSTLQSPARCAVALASAPEGRTAILRATLTASDSSWARLVRAALRETTPYASSVQAEGRYRDAPERTASEPVERVVTAERARITRVRTIGVGAAIAACCCATALLSAQPVLMGLLIAGALLAGWRALANGGRARATLDETARALPEIVAALPPPPPPQALAAVDPSPVSVHTRGCLVTFFLIGIGFGGLLIVALLVFEMTQRLSAKEIGMVFAAHVLLSVFSIFLCVLLPRIHAKIDIAQGEVIFVHRLLGITYTRTVVPLEIVERFFGERGSLKRPSYVGIDIARAQPDQGHRRRSAPRTADHIRLVDGDGVEGAANALNTALGIDS